MPQFGVTLENGTPIAVLVSARVGWWPNAAPWLCAQQREKPRMKLQEMIDMLPPREDVVRMARYFAQMRQPDRSSLVLTAAAGVFVGATLALLFAPNSGRELRRQIGEQAEGLRERANEFGSRIKSNGGVAHSTV
jgi:hypothetical protein